MKQHQGFAPENGIPPLDKPDEFVAASSQKAEFLVSYLSDKMTVPEPNVPPPKLPPQTLSRLYYVCI